MQRLKLLAVMCLLFAVPAPESRAGSAERQNESLRGMSRSTQSPHRPFTIWERMQDPKDWWHSRFASSNSQGGSLRPRGLVSGEHPLTGSAITNPIFFIPPTYGSGGRFARNAEVGDFNGDGKPDLLISNECVSDSDCTQGTVAVLLGIGDGTYQPALVSPTGAVLSAVAVGDFNRDGKLDVAVDNACPDIGCASGSVNILLGNGNGTFQPPVAYASGGNAFSVEAGDVNGDGKLDVVVVNGSNSAGVLLGNGDGTFKPVSSFPTSASGNSAVFLGDFNGDSKLDLAVVTGNCDATPTCTRSVNVLIGNGDGTFGPPLGNQSTAGLNSQAVALGDVNGDGNLDLAVVDDCVPITDTCEDEFVDVFVGNGDGTFKTAKSSVLSTTDVTFIEFGDLNGDGKPDLATVDPDAASATVMLGAGDGKLQFLNSYETDGTSPLFGILGDLNGDGKTDFAIANACQVNFQDSCTGAVIALLGDGRGFLAGPVGYDVGGLSSALATADLNQDGTPDLAVAIQCGSRTDCSTSGVSVLLGKPDGTFQPPVSYGSGGHSPASVAAGDLNGDGKLDLLVLNSCVTQLDCSHGIIGVLFGNGDGTFHAPVTYPSGGVSPKSVAIGDFNGDGKLDLGVVQCADLDTCSNGSNGSVSVLLGNGNGSFGAAVNYSSGAPFSLALVTADINGDAKLDLVVANGNCAPTPDGLDILCSTGSVGVLLGNGDGSFQTAVTYSTVDDDAFSLALGDLNGDGKPDLTVGNTNCQDLSPCLNGSVAVLLGNGDGTFKAAATYPAGDPWPGLDGRTNALAIADLDRDGKADLVLSNRNVLLGNGDGTFQDAQSYNPARNLAQSALVADFNGDGKPDLAVNTSPLLTVLLNISASGSQDFGVVATPLSPATIAAGGSSTSIVTITPINGFNGSVSLSCSAIAPSVTPPPTCAFVPSSVAGGSGTSTLTVSTTAPAGVAAGTPVGNYSFTVSATSGTLAHSQTIALSVQAAPLPDFQISASALSPGSVPAGGSATSTITIAPLNAFSGTVNLTCSVAPVVTPAPTCTLVPNSIANGSGTSMLTVSTTPATTASVAPQLKGVFYAMWLPIGVLALIGAGFTSHKKKILCFLFGCLLFSGLILLGACGGGSSPTGGGGGGRPGTPSGAYTITVTGTGATGSPAHSTTLALTVQ